MRVEYYWSGLATVGVFAVMLVLVAITGAPYLILGFMGATFLGLGAYVRLDVKVRGAVVRYHHRQFLRFAVPFAAACLSCVAFAATYDPTPAVTWRVAGLIGIVLPIAVHLLLSRSMDVIENRAMLVTMTYCIGVGLCFFSVVPFASLDHLLPALAVCFLAVLLPAAFLRHALIEGLRTRVPSQ